MTRSPAFLAALLSIAPTTQALPAALQQTSPWPGWDGIKFWFSFGDSYTATGFNISLTQPSADNPLGNPTYPGYTSSNGPNWVDYLTTTYNASLVQTYNLAYGGATIDSALIAPYDAAVLSVKQQVQEEFLLTYTGTPAEEKFWTGEDTLFSIFIGINDVGNSYRAQNSSLTDMIFQEYGSLVDQLFTSGARNFLFLNVPPVQRSPLTTAQGNASVVLEAAAIADWNERVATLAASLQQNHTETDVFTFDAYSLFNEVLDNPASFEATSVYKNTTAYCEGYENGTAEGTTLIASCGIPVNEYFWLNSLHPTYPMHDVLAAQISDQLKACEKGAYP